MPACKEMSCKVGYFRCLFLSTLFLFTPYFLSAQTNKLDSLKKVFLAYHKIDTVKANLLLSICRESAYLREPRKQLDIYAPQLLALSYKLNYKKGISYALLYKGTGSYHKNKLDEERENLLQSLKMMEEMNDVSGQGFCYFELGRLFGFNNKFPEAISYYKKAIDAKNKVNDKEGMSLSYSRIGAIYDFTGDYEKAQQYLFKGLKLAEEINHINRICESYICIGIIFYEQNKFEETIQYMNKALALGDTTANKQNLMYIYNNIAIAYIGLKDSLKGLEYQFKALRVEEELDNQAGIARSYSNIGSTYVGLNKPKEALMYHLKAVALDEKLNNLQGLSYSYNGAGGYYEWVKDYENANAYYLKALDVSKQSGFKVGIRDAYGLLSSVNEKRKNFEKALEYHKLSSELKDSILNENNLKQTAELNIRYETEKKSKEILLLTKDQQLKDKSLKEQRLIRIGLIIGLILFLLLSFLLYNRYRFKQKANVLLEKQKEEIKQKNVLITDSIDYAKTIQEAILPDDEKLTSLFPDHFILYKPKDIVSGDFYWVGKKEGAVICVVADCTGHGVPGAFMSLLGHNILENSILQSSATMDPGQMLTILNKEIVTRFSKNTETVRHGMDIAVISIHPEDKTLQYAGAKNPIYIVRDQELTEIKADKFSTGTVLKDRNPLLFTNHKQSIQKGDMIYLFSDGFPDQKGGTEKKKFFYKPFKELLTSISNLPVDQQKKQLDQTITEWIGSGEQVDDILIMGIRFTG